MQFARPFFSSRTILIAFDTCVRSQAAREHTLAASQRQVAEAEAAAAAAEEAGRAAVAELEAMQEAVAAAACAAWHRRCSGKGTWLMWQFSWSSGSFTILYGPSSRATHRRVEIQPQHSLKPRQTPPSRTYDRLGVVVRSR